MTNFPKPRNFSFSNTIKTLCFGLGVPVIASIMIVALFDRGLSLNAIPVFLVGIMFVASTSGVQTAILAAISSFLLLMLLIFEPRFNLQFVSNDDYLNLAIFLVAALVAGYLSGLARDKGLTAIEKAKQLEALFDAASQVLTCRDASDVYQVILRTADRISPQKWYVNGGLGSKDTDSSSDGLDLPDARRSIMPDIIIRGPQTSSYLCASLPIQTLPGTQKSLEMLAKLAEGALTRIQVQQDFENAKVTATSDALRATILNSVAHDLRTPLSSIAASAATLEDHSDAISESEKVLLARSIRVGAERLGRFISKLLTAARIESGPVKVQLQFIEVHDLISGILEAFSQHHHKAGVQWDSTGSNLEIYCDPVLLDQAIYNIIENCLDYSPPSEPVRISVFSGEYMRIQIADAGPGIAPDLREHVFDRWTRGGQPSKARTGLGLGLSISRGFIQALGGEVIAIDKPDGSTGACFEIQLPSTMVRVQNETS